MFSSKDIFLGKGGATGYQISRSVRLRSSASAFFNRTPASASNRQTWTWSGWVKRGVLGSQCDLFCGDSSTTISEINIGSDDTLKFWQSGTTLARQSTAVFRDPSAWYHIVVVLDTTNATAQNRCRMYVNGVEITTWTTNNTITQNSQFGINTATAHNLGRSTAASIYFDGYLTEINFIDGQALTPSSFGATNTTTGVWGPARYTGTYGTNGFYLNFSDNSAATAAAIGKDYSGNGNNWTPNNISVTAGATYDSMVDTPTPYGSDTGAGGTVRGNYAVMSPIVPTGAAIISGGNLNIVGAGTYCNGLSTINLDSGAYYCECVVTTHSTEAWGVWDITKTAAANTGTTPSGFYGIYSGGATLMSNGTNVTTNAAGTPANGDIVQVAWSNGKVWLGKNNTWYDSSFGTTGNPSAGTNATFTGLTISQFAFVFCNGNASSSLSANFGQRAFSYTAPTGYKALNTQNLSTPTIANGASYMAATTYAGNSSSQSITNTVNSASFKPDFVWVKNRSSVTNHYLWDSVRGALKELYSNLTSAEATNTIGLSAFNSNGFTLNNGDAAWNASGSNYIGWQWLAGAGSSSSNTNGSITSTVSVNQTAGFSVVGYTGNGVTSATVGHGLGVTPSMVIVKSRSAVSDWFIWHTSLSSGYQLRFTTAAQEQVSSATTAGGLGTPTSTTIGFISGSINTNNVNTNAATYVAYCFAPIAGYSAFGSYTGNGSTDGTFVYTGFRPRWVMIKRYGDGTNNWEVRDTSRDLYNTVDDRLFPNTSAAEDANNEGVDFLSNGFKIRNAGTGSNASGASYIYAAFAENPTKYALAR